MDLDLIIGFDLHKLAELIFVLLLPEVGFVALLREEAVCMFHVKRLFKRLGLSYL